jgi:hypothetical protein
MFGTKFFAIAMAAVRIAAAGAVGMAVLAGAPLIVSSALPGHRIEPWVSTQPQNLAFVTGLNHCHAAARRLRDFATPIPPECVNSGWNAIVNPPPPGENPPPPDDDPLTVDAQPPANPPPLP